MRTNLTTLLGVGAVVAALAGGPAVFAYAETQKQQGSGGMMQGGQGNIMGMMSMMGQMNQMMEACTQMMQSMHRGGAERPNEQWRRRSPEQEG